MMKIFSVIILSFAFFGFSRTVDARIYKCTDEKGVVHFSNIPKNSCYSPADVEEYTQTNEDRIKKDAEAEKVRLAKGPIRIGMSAKQVLASSWGKPQRVNRTTNSNGIHEQWVYEGGAYLYFDQALLTTIQN